MKVLTNDRDELLLAVGRGPIDRSRLHRQMTKDDETQVTLSQEGKIPGVSGTLTVSKTYFKAIGAFLCVPLPNLPKFLRFNKTLIDSFPNSVVVCAWVVLSWRESELISTVKPGHKQRLHLPEKESQSFNGDLWSNEEAPRSLIYSLEKSFEVPILVSAPVCFKPGLQ